jgi:hypothetical protein
MPLRAPRIDVTTGAFTCRFSRVPNVLPTESETGNLIKIVQRLPARMCRVGRRSSRRDRWINGRGSTKIDLARFVDGPLTGARPDGMVTQRFRSTRRGRSLNRTEAVAPIWAKCQSNRIPAIRRLQTSRMIDSLLSL